MTRSPITMFASMIAGRISDRTYEAHAIDILALAAVWVSMVALARPWGDFPVNDDWVYAAAARSVLNGQFEVYSFASANVGLLAYWGALFARIAGNTDDALRLSTWCLGLVGVVAIYATTHLVWQSRILALVAALATAVDPIYFSLSCTFMTDVPFFALVALSMLAILHGIDRDDDRYVICGLLIALATVTMRQFAVVVFAGYSLAHCERRGYRAATALIAVLPLAAALVFNEVFTGWLVESGRKPYPGGIPTLLPQVVAWGNIERSLLTSLSEVGLLVMPVALLCMPEVRAARWRVVAVATVAAVLTAAFIGRGLLVPAGDNVLHWYGIGPLTNSDTLFDNKNMPEPTRFVRWTQVVMTALAICAAAGILVAGTRGALHQAQRRWQLGRAAGTASDARAFFLVGTTAAYAAFLLLVAATGGTVFDRYLLPLTLVATLVIPVLVGRSALMRVARQRAVAAGIVLLFTAVFTVVTTHDFFAWSATRWHALQQLVDSGVSPRRIDGGYEFNGSLLYDPLYKPKSNKSWYWVDDDEYLTSSGPLTNYVVLQVYPVSRWWTGGGRDVFVLLRSNLAADRRGARREPGDSNAADAALKR